MIEFILIILNKLINEKNDGKSFFLKKGDKSKCKCKPRRGATSS